MSRRSFLIAAGALGAGAALPSAAVAQAGYPAKPIRMIIGFAPGGPTDIVSRIIAQKMSEQMGQQVVVENRPGAGGNLAAEVAAKAAPDGYTTFYNTSAITIAPSFFGKLAYDPLKDYAPVGLAATVPMVLVINPALGPRSLREFIDFARSRQGRLNYASSGSGTIVHLAGALFTKEAGIQAVHVPYRGSAPAMTDLMAGQVQYMVDTVNSQLPMIREGRVRALAVAMTRRLSVLPDVPTLHETVLPNVEMSAWQGIVVPTGTPQPIIERLNTELNRAVASADVREKLAAQGTEPLGNTTPAQYAAYIRSEITRWAQVVKESGARPD
jgi:tripartite-type tricarboxylate transporter receptor subunit TctC